MGFAHLLILTERGLRLRGSLPPPSLGHQKAWDDVVVVDPRQRLEVFPDHLLLSHHLLHLLVDLLELDVSEVLVEIDSDHHQILVLRLADHLLLEVE